MADVPGFGPIREPSVTVGRIVGDMQDRIRAIPIPRQQPVWVVFHLDQLVAVFTGRPPSQSQVGDAFADYCKRPGMTAENVSAGYRVVEMVAQRGEGS